MELEKVQEQYRKITLLLIKHHKTITTMESCTSGLLASLITDTEGASGIMKGAFVTYCNEAKIMEGVPEEIICTYGVYSMETAKAMAAAAKKTFQSDISIGITGSFGNVDPANKDSVPGEIFFVVSGEKKSKEVFLTLDRPKTRFVDKLRAALAVGEALMDLLQEELV